MSDLSSLRNRVVHAILTTVFRVARQPRLVRLGNPGADWIVPSTVFGENSICYCAGAGEDITFELDMIRKFGCTVFAFDPTPRAIEHVKKAASGYPSFHFLPIGLWSSETELRFFRPKDPAHVSHSALNLQGTSDFFRACCKPVSRIMQELGHNHIDLLKLDIEGAEYEVLKDLARNDVHPSVLCIEFDQPMPVTRTLQAIANILRVGYALVAVDVWNYTFVFKGSAGESFRVLWQLWAGRFNR